MTCRFMAIFSTEENNLIGETHIGQGEFAQGRGCATAKRGA